MYTEESFSEVNILKGGSEYSPHSVVMGRLSGTLPPFPRMSSWSEAGYFVKWFTYDAVTYISIPPSGMTCFVPSLMQRLYWTQYIATRSDHYEGSPSNQHISECERGWSLPVTSFPYISAICSGKELSNGDKKDLLSFILSRKWVTTDEV